MATPKDEARETLLKQIKEAADGTTSAVSLRNLAEAYAWVISPNQPHGGQATTTS